VIDASAIPRLKALWATADAAFRMDDAYVVEMAEESHKVFEKRRKRQERAEARAAERESSQPLGV
jgi:hypothetical protein